VAHIPRCRCIGEVKEVLPGQGGLLSWDSAKLGTMQIWYVACWVGTTWGIRGGQPLCYVDTEVL
jgi:hypothetical protein